MLKSFLLSTKDESKDWQKACLMGDGQIDQMCYWIEDQQFQMQHKNGLKEWKSWNGMDIEGTWGHNITLMAALLSWPLLNSWAISLRKTFSWLSRLFFSSFIRDIAIRNDVLLYNKQNFKVNNRWKIAKNWTWGFLIYTIHNYTSRHCYMLPWKRWNREESIELSVVKCAGQGMKLLIRGPTRVEKLGKH